MQLKKLNNAFIVTTGVSAVVFVYLVFLGYDEIKTLKDVVKIIASILFPLPMLFFVRFLLIEHFLPQNTDEYKLKHQKPATILLVASVIIGVVSMQVVERVTGQTLEDHL
ncbi:MAG: purine-cytosine permease-like protein, partial [Psychroserpens sp.]